MPHTHARMRQSLSCCTRKLTHMLTRKLTHMLTIFSSSHPTNQPVGLPIDRPCVRPLSLARPRASTFSHKCCVHLDHLLLPVALTRSLSPCAYILQLGYTTSFAIYSTRKMEGMHSCPISQISWKLNMLQRLVPFTHKTWS